MSGFKVVFNEFSVNTRSRFEVVDVTREVEHVVGGSGVSDGVVLVYTPHTTAAIIVNEAEPGLKSDYIELVKELFKPGGPWRHNTIDNNAHAHLASALVGPGRLIPLRNGRLVLGTWQSIMLLEMDGPRRRRVIVEVMGVGRG